jgi:hypothetical protein
MTDARVDHGAWPMRALILMAGGALCGLAVHFLIRGDDGAEYGVYTENVLRLSLAIMVAAGGILFAFTFERVRWTWSAIFALAGGFTLGAIYYWNGSPEHHSADDFYRAVASLLGVAIAAPLFQAMRDEGRRSLPYVAVHAHAWTNVVLWFAAWAFVGITFLLLLLLSQLFKLIGISLLEDLLEKGWFGWMLCGGALGAAIGLLRDRDRVLGLLQRVVTTVLSVLAPVLAIGLVLFVLSLPITGLERLWEETQATTPILLACAIGAIILANAVIGNAPEEEATAAPLRWSAMALGAVMAPLVVVAAISTGLRIGQHGLTPARLWAIVFIVIAAAYALAYLYALVRGRTGWADRVRPLNLKLAIGVCLVALFLATPIARFGAIATSSQLARLETGQVSPAEFDWRAMRFDFGASGLAALERLEATGSPEVRRFAATALAADYRFDLEDPSEAARNRAIVRNIRVIPGGGQIPPQFSDVLAPGTCVGERHCILFYRPGEDVAVMVTPAFCRRGVGPCEPDVDLYYLVDGNWRRDPPSPEDFDATRLRHERLQRGLAEGRAEIRAVPRRQVFIDGEPVGYAF